MRAVTNHRISELGLVALLILVALSSNSYVPHQGTFVSSSETSFARQTIDPLFNEFKIPTNQSGPEAIIQDTSNSQRFWFTEYQSGKIGELWENGTVLDFRIPETRANATGLAMDSHGNIWFADQAAAGSIWEFIPSLAPSNQAFRQYFTKTPNSFPYAVIVDRSDNVWFTEGSGDRLGKFPAGGSISNNITEYPTPTGGSGPTGLVAQNDTSFLWIAESYANKIARFDTAKGTFTEFAEPLNLPLGIATDAHGNVWISEHDGSSVDEFVPSNSTFRKYPTSPATVASGYSMTGPATVSVDKLDRIWFVEHYASRVGLLNPTTGLMEEFPVPYDSYSLLDTVDSHGNFWFTEYSANRIAMVNGTVSVPIDIQAKTAQNAVVTAGQSLHMQFSILDLSSSNVTVSLSSASSFSSVYQNMASEVSLNETSLSLSPSKEVGVDAVIKPDLSLSSGLYSVGLVAIYGSNSIVKDVFLNVDASVLYQLEIVLPYILTAVAIVVVLALFLTKRRRNRLAMRRQTVPKIAMLILGILLLLTTLSLPTVEAKCPGRPPPSGGTSSFGGGSGPDYYGIALDIGSIAFFGIVAYLLIRERLRARRPSEGKGTLSPP